MIERLRRIITRRRGVIISPFLCQLFSVVVSVGGITLWPFIIFREAPSEVDERHERIHLKQQAELLVLGFYAVYVYDWLRNRARGFTSTDAYMLIRFEQEAYANERDPQYLAKRKPWAWLDYRAP